MSTTTTTTAPPSTTPSHQLSTSSFPRGDTTTTLKFFQPPTDPSEPAWQLAGVDPKDHKRNYTDIDHSVHIQDARGHESLFRNLDDHAFALLPGPYKTDSRVNWFDDDSIKKYYYPEVEKLLKEETGGKEIVLFDHTIRRADPNSPRAPVTRVHIDQTPKSGAQRVRLHSASPAEASARLSQRYRIINVWRSIAGPVESFPLAFAESGSLPDTDMVPVEHRYPDRTGETAGIKFSKDEEGRQAQRWWYWSGTGDEERILLQCFDSEAPATRVPHSAFNDERAGPGARGRESIEVRALVFG